MSSWRHWIDDGVVVVVVVVVVAAAVAAVLVLSMLPLLLACDGQLRLIGDALRLRKHWTGRVDSVVYSRGCVVKVVPCWLGVGLLRLVQMPYCFLDGWHWSSWAWNEMLLGMTLMPMLSQPRDHHYDGSILTVSVVAIVVVVAVVVAVVVVAAAAAAALPRPECSLYYPVGIANVERRS